VGKNLRYSQIIDLDLNVTACCGRWNIAAKKFYSAGFHG